MFAEHAPDGGQGHVLPVVEPQSQPILRRHPVNGRIDAALHLTYQCRSFGIVRLGCWSARRWRLFVERLETPRRPMPIDVALDEHRTHPRDQPASAVIVRQQRAAPSVGAGQSEEIPVQRVGQLAPVVARHGPRRVIQLRPEFADEVLPRTVVAVEAGVRECEVGDVQRVEIRAPVVGGGAFGKAMPEARRQRFAEAVDAHLPRLRAAFGVQPPRQVGVERGGVGVHRENSSAGLQACISGTDNTMRMSQVTVLGATPAFRRGVLVVALVLVVLEIGLFAVLWRLGVLIDPGADSGAAATFVALGTVLTLQAMAVVGVVWLMVALAWTTLRSDIVGWSLDHPWRSWHGSPADVASVKRNGGWLVVKVHGHRRRWYVRISAADPAEVDQVLADVPT